jgi:hypothetical protein
VKPFVAIITPVDCGAYPDQGLPKPEAPVDPGYGIPIERPEHPIYFPLPPGAPVDPDYGIPVDPPSPEHPIVLPPDSGGWDPVYIWGPTDPRPTPPIVIPPDVPPEGEQPGIKFVAIWTPKTGWVVIGIPTGPHPTPSKKKK